ncbi:hypothetical protein WG902_14130 [Ramlibacter sp. PS3R-8]|uniref:hypothetical protein n=1 Tax=Ramlibacter sp. PS3R-8 TaxID=3133437 RepID=UPI0030A51E81
MVRWMPLSLVAGVALMGLAHGSASASPFKCMTSSGVTYSQVPCPGGGGRDMSPAARRVTDKSVPPPQDRATLARRAPLSADEKRECQALDKTMRDQRAQLKARGDAVTIEDEMPLVRNQKRYREVGC